MRPLLALKFLKKDFIELSDNQNQIGDIVLFKSEKDHYDFDRNNIEDE